MDPITVHHGDCGPPVTVQQIYPPNTWELNILDAVTDNLPRILESAEHVILQNGGDRITVNCPQGAQLSATLSTAGTLAPSPAPAPRTPSSS